MKKRFSPLSFLAAVGAGGISVIPFAFLNYTLEHPKGLIKISDISSSNYDLLNKLLFFSLESVMILFSIIHFVFLFYLIYELVLFIKSDEFDSFMNNPLKNFAILTPFIALVMSMNVIIGPVRFFIPLISDNLQSFMLPALIFWLGIFLSFFVFEMKVIKSNFASPIDLKKIGFGWLIDVFALSMIAVTGSGIAALSTSSSIASVAAFFSLMAALMALFFLFIKIVLVFQRHYSDTSLPEKQFLPGFLNVVPTITLLSITFFRLAHYFSHHSGLDAGWFYTIVITSGFAFETWYLVFGLYLLVHYFKNYHFEKDHFASQWALVCPFVAYAVISAFTYSFFVPSIIFKTISIISMILAIIVFFDLLIKFLFCKKGKYSCEEA
jgi:tellurite resistance protein TehA-like permease